MKDKKEQTCKLFKFQLQFFFQKKMYDIYKYRTHSNCYVNCYNENS